METAIRKIGNSRGIIIPAPLLAACNITDRVEMEQKGDTLVLHRPTSPRKGWFADYKEDPAFAAEAREWEESGVSEGDWEW